MRIESGLLNDTLNLVQMARETALAKGKEAQAQRLSPVVAELKTLAATKRDTVAPAAPSATMAQGDFRTLLAAANKGSTQPAQSAQTMAGGDRNRMVLAMASGSMHDVDIARQLGMTLDEVRMVISANQKSRISGMEVKK
jgi:hypothetical protein